MTSGVLLVDALGLLLAEDEPAGSGDSRRLLIEKIVERLPVGVVVADTVGVFQFVNRRMADMFGLGLVGLSVENWSYSAAQLTRLDGSEISQDVLPPTAPHSPGRSATLRRAIPH